MYSDIKEDIKHCLICQIYKKPLNSFQRFRIDFIDPLTERLNGNKSILVMTEYYTK